MKNSDTPKDGDFASYLDGMKDRAAGSEITPGVAENTGAPDEVPQQTIEQILIGGEEPTEEFLDRWNALENAPEISDEELARQALDAPGEDGDPSTPE